MSLVKAVSDKKTIEKKTTNGGVKGAVMKASTMGGLAINKGCRKV